jgi:hypothetical protein
VLVFAPLSYESGIRTSYKFGYEDRWVPGDQEALEKGRTMYLSRIEAWFFNSPVRSLVTILPELCRLIGSHLCSLLLHKQQRQHLQNNAQFTVLCLSLLIDALNLRVSRCVENGSESWIWMNEEIGCSQADSYLEMAIFVSPSVSGRPLETIKVSNGGTFSNL